MKVGIGLVKVYNSCETIIMFLGPSQVSCKSVRYFLNHQTDRQTDHAANKKTFLAWVLNTVGRRAMEPPPPLNISYQAAL